uniref:Thrombospondin type 1 domain containing 1 n=1 Tax=Callorhinchus milii TaxID=7868 RepID=A0A4W3KEI5_CALMI
MQHNALERQPRLYEFKYGTPCNYYCIISFLFLFAAVVFAEVSYRLSRQLRHVALSNQTIYVDVRDLSNQTVQDVTVSLVDVSRNQTVTTKSTAGNQSQASVGFECFHFKQAGEFEFRGRDLRANGTTEWTSEILHVEWPAFHTEVKRKSDVWQSSFQVGVFTSEFLCPWWPSALRLSLDVTSSDFHQPGMYDKHKALKRTISKDIELSNSQWVEFDCSHFRQDSLITILLRAPHTGEVISSEGPLVFDRIFGYKLVVDHLKTSTCELSTGVHIVAPPCVNLQGTISVYKDSFTRESFVAENWLHPGNNKTEFNCSLFDAGKSNYCFKYVSVLNHSHSAPKAKSCVTLQIDAERWTVWLSWSPCSVTCGDGTRERYRQCISPSSGNVKCTGENKEVSHCSLEAVFHPKGSGNLELSPPKASNIVTITGIFLCLVIIIGTVAIAIRTKLSCKEEKCNLGGRRGSLQTHNLSEDPGDDRILGNSNRRVEDGTIIPLSCRRSHVPEKVSSQDGLSEEGLPSAQRVVPPIFGYRLAHQQLKEMKKKGITEATHVYHVTQRDEEAEAETDRGVATVPALEKESNMENSVNRFRIQAPFLDQKQSMPCKAQVERANHWTDFELAQFGDRGSERYLHRAVAQTLCRAAAAQCRQGQCEGGIGGGHSRRTCSFSEYKGGKYYRERSRSAGTSKLQSSYHSRAAYRTGSSMDRCNGSAFPPPPLPPPRSGHTTTSAKPPGWSYSGSANLKHHPKSRSGKAEQLREETITGAVNHMELSPSKPRSGPTNRYHSPTSLSDPSSAEKYYNWKYPWSNPLPRHHYRQERCQSFPSAPSFLPYDNSGFDLSALDQRVTDVAGYFDLHVKEGEGDTTTLSNEKLVV